MKILPGTEISPLLSRKLITMITYGINRTSLNKVHSYLQQRLGRAEPAVIRNCRSIERSLQKVKQDVDVFHQAAKVYSELRGNSSLFACYRHDSMSLEVMSGEGVLATGTDRPMLPSDTPNPLLGYILLSRYSVHVPEIRGMDRRSLAQRISDSGGQEILSMGPIELEMFEQELVNSTSLPARQVNALLPLGFTAEKGSLLATPLGLEKSARFAYGFMLEYQTDRKFSIAEVSEAQTYSALFTMEIVRRVFSGLGA